MDIKYIKDAPNGAAGTSDTVTDIEGNVLIKTGFAVLDKPPKPRKTKAKADTDTDTDTESE